MIIRINGFPLPPGFGDDLKATLHEVDGMYSDSSLINHLAQFYRMDTNREAQAFYDEAVQAEISRHSIIMAAKVKAYLAVNIFDPHNLGIHLHHWLGMTS